MKILEKMKGIKDIIGSFKSDWARDKYVRKLKYQIALAKRRNRIKKEERDRKWRVNFHDM